MILLPNEESRVNICNQAQTSMAQTMKVKGQNASTFVFSMSERR